MNHHNTSWSYTRLYRVLYLRDKLRFFLRIFIFAFFFLFSFASVAQINIQNHIFRSKQAIVADRYAEALDLLNDVIKIRPDMHEPFFLRAIAKYNLGDFKGAEGDLTSAIDIKPNFPDALMYRGICRERLMNFNSALNDFDRALEIDPLHDGVFVAKAFTKTLQQDYDAAIDLCNKAIRINRKNERAYLCRAWCKYKLYDLTGAAEDYAQALKINPFNADTYTKRGMVRAFELKYSEALEDFNRSLEIDSLNLHTLYQLADVHKELDDFEEAEKLYTRMIEIDPEIAVAYYERAHMLAEKGETAAAIDDFTMVNVLTGGHLFSYFSRGSLYYEMGKFSAAVEDLSKAIELYPELAEAYYNRALAYSRLNMHDQAAADVERAKEIKAELYALDEVEQQQEMKKIQEIAQINDDLYRADGMQNQRMDIKPAPDYFIVPFAWVPEDHQNEVIYVHDVPELIESKENWVVISHLGWSLPDATKIRDEVNEALSENPDDVQLLFRQGVVFQLMQNYDLAVEVYDAVLAVAPDHVPALLNRAYVLSKMLLMLDAYAESPSHAPFSPAEAGINENYEQIASGLKQIIRNKPDFIPARFNLANLNAASGNHSHAIEAYQLIIKSKAESAPVQFNLGLSLLYLNSNESACQHLSAAGELGYLQAYRVIKRFCQ